jgi:polar amino acid transport system substrate-binding protein
MRVGRMAALLCLGALLPGAVAMASEISADIVAALAPQGRIRAAINYGNPVLAQQDPATGEPRGVSAALARELGRRLGTPVEFIPYDAAGKVFEALKTESWDVAFLAIDPVRASGIDFTAPYVVIEGTYVVPADSPLSTIEAVDRPGIRIAVGRGSAYDLYLTRALKQAERVEAPSSAAALDLFLSDRLDAAAGVRQPLLAFAASHPGLRVLPGRFMAIEQAVAIPKGRPAGARYLRGFVEEMKASGFVERALAESGQGDAAVAPPE